MTMNWNDIRVSFEEHTKSMREFRRSHGNVAMVNVPKPNEFSFLQSMHPLLANQIKVEIGGLDLLDNALDWTSFVPILRVASYKLPLN